MAVAAWVLLLLPLSAREQADTVYTFRFVADGDMFYVPYGGNDAELARLERRVEELKGRILAGEVLLHVDGYSTAGESDAEKLGMARIRSNRVKSELIVRQQLREACFVTRNHAGGGDYVTVRVVVPAGEMEGEMTGEVMPAAGREEREGQEAEEAEWRRKEEWRPEEERVARERAERERLVAERTKADSLAAKRARVGSAAEGGGIGEGDDSYAFSLRANLLRWVTLTPDLGVEWRIAPGVGVLVQGSWTSWTWREKERRYALWEVVPEVRWYPGESRRWYAGAMFKAGAFNYKFSGTGRQGDLVGGGVTGGCQLRLNGALCLDFGLGLGYLNVDTERYEVIDGVRVRRGTETKSWWGPVHAGVTLVWTLF